MPSATSAIKGRLPILRPSTTWQCVFSMLFTQLLHPLPASIMLFYSHQSHRSQYSLSFWSRWSTKSRAARASSQGSWPSLPLTCISLLTTNSKWQGVHATTTHCKLTSFSRPFSRSTRVIRFSSVLFLHPFWKRTSEDEWHRAHRQHALPVTHPTALWHRRKLERLSPTRDNHPHYFFMVLLVRVCLCVRIIVHNCHTQHST